MNTDNISEKMEQIEETDDVAEKRLEMYRIFETLLESRTEESSLSELKEMDGYMYKLSQEFLLSSSTGEKGRKLEKILEHVQRKV